MAIFNLTPEIVKLKDRDSTVYLPLLDIVVMCKHKVSKPIRCYIDTGATLNVFPKDFALAFFGFSEKSLKKDAHVISITGVGGIQVEGYGHKCTIHALDFTIESVYIYFVENQSMPLLGRYGFMNKFKKIIFDEEKKTLEIIK